MAKENEEINVHIIHSMKGGCGKSTCALFKALQIAQRRGIKDRKAHVLFLDADFKGSAMTEILFHSRNLSGQAEDSPGKREQEQKSHEREQVQKLHELEIKFGKGMPQGTGVQHQLAIPDNFDDYITISDYLRDSSRCSISDIICRSCSYQPIEKDQTKAGANDSIDDSLPPVQGYSINGYIDFILSSADSESKDWFRHTQGKIAAGVYSYRMDALLRNLLIRGVVNQERIGDYWDIVIDMPPGYDEYSDILLELLRRIAKEDEKLKLHYYAVTTEDIGHKFLTMGNLKKAIGDDTKYKPFFSVNLILSDVSHTDFSILTDQSKGKDEAEEKKKEKEKEIYWSWLEEDSNPNGKLYVNAYSESYHGFCRKGILGEFEQNINEVLKDISLTGAEKEHDDDKN